MSRIQSNKTRIGLIAVALVGGINFASSAFSAEALPQGYQLASAEKASEGKCGEGKCGEGKCGASEASAQKTQAEGKCGEGKCGDASFARTDVDHDGRVSLKELLAVAPKGTEEFKAMDANGDGFLSEGEVYKFRTNQYTSNGKKVPTELFTKLSQAKD
ncbi:UNVERIFIED_ORG: putative low-complexity protein [Pseudomonas putida]|nr:putative low-complexity protein [Pseudomonas putida]